MGIYYLLLYIAYCNFVGPRLQRWDTSIAITSASWMLNTYVNLQTTPYTRTVVYGWNVKVWWMYCIVTQWLLCVCIQLYHRASDRYLYAAYENDSVVSFERLQFNYLSAYVLMVYLREFWSWDPKTEREMSQMKVIRSGSCQLNQGGTGERMLVPHHVSP